MISGSGQRTVVRQVLEICPTNKILWSNGNSYRRWSLASRVVLPKNYSGKIAFVRRPLRNRISRGVNRS
ncbi:hypothetical protein F5890DRAFT_1547488 [Lentinula detonsa]|uniref:Uncharacterized protein n=1 Tax=Lentinula detonsa TaxID=2804962 RepID=A0AA38UMU6_9AGAR|nr:hypothetical protein F5890DRAFT_1547488 [Lentinula detonsa]